MAISKTDVLGLNVPDYTEPRWDIPVSENWELLDNFAGYTPAIKKALAGITDPVTDIFIYETSKDADPTWPDKANYQSWYLEGLNTATRGKTRNWPKTSIMVLTTGNLHIFDATAPDVPMWMIFVGAANNWLFDKVSFPKSSVVALNGYICVGHINGGFIKINIIGDSCRFYQAAQGVCNGTMVLRNSAQQYTPEPSKPGIIDNIVNDMAICVIPGAPIDIETNMPRPTIVALTPDGFTVIDGAAGVGTLIDFDWNAAWKTCAFEGTRFWGQWPSGIFAMDITGLVTDYVLYSAAQTEIDFAASEAKFYYDQGAGTNTIPAPMQSTGNNISIAGSATGAVKGLTLFSEDFSALTKGMVAYITDAYNTGWLCGDVRRAFICEAGGLTETIGDDNLAGNGWTNFGAGYSYETLIADGPNIASAINTTNNAAAYGAPLPLIVGEWYYAIVNLTLNSGTAPKLTIGAVDNAASGDVLNYILVPGINIITWKCSSNDFRTPWFWQTAPTNTSTDFSATFFVGAQLEDRSVKATGFFVNGTLHRTPVATGSDLQCLHGFTGNDFLSQGYSADLDFGTGDFYFCCWASLSPNGTTHGIVTREYTSGGAFTGSNFCIIANDLGKIRFFITNNGYTLNDMVESVSALSGSEYSFIVALRRGSKLEMWVNGIKEAESDIVNTTGSLNNPDVSLKVGLFNSASPFEGWLALLKLGAGSPSPGQIAKMYEDEKKLFQPYSGARLKTGTSQVDALAFEDPVLYVAGPGGLTEVQGLRTALSARAAGAITGISAAAKILATGTASSAIVEVPAFPIGSSLTALQSEVEEANDAALDATSFPIYNAGTVDFKRGDVVRISGGYGNMAAGALSLAAGVATNSIVNGLATTDIPAGGTGRAVFCGVLDNVDLTGFAAGDPVYLSSTVAGKYQKTIADVVSNVGVCVVGGSTGSLLIDLFGNRALPSVVAVLYGKPGTFTIPTGSTPLAPYSSVYSVRMPADPTGGSITPPYSGAYRLNISMSISFTSTNAVRELIIDFWQGANLVKTIPQAIPRDVDAASFTISFPIQLTGGLSYGLAVRGSAQIDNVLYSDLSYDLESIRISNIGGTAELLPV